MKQLRKAEYVSKPYSETPLLILTPWFPAACSRKDKKDTFVPSEICWRRLRRRLVGPSDLLTRSRTSTTCISSWTSWEEEVCRGRKLVVQRRPGADLTAALTDLLTLLIERDTFPEDMARFYFAEMVLAVEETHKVLGAIHRDVIGTAFQSTKSRKLTFSATDQARQLSVRPQRSHSDQ